MSRAERIRIQRIIRRLGKLEDGSARAQRRLLAVLRREILAEVAEASTFERWRLTSLLNAVDRFIAAGRLSAEMAAAGGLEGAWAVGLEMGTVGTGSLTGISRELLTALLDVTRDQVRAVWSELGSRLKLVIRRATFGVDPVGDTIKRLALAIRDRKNFASAEARAETIVRTEVNRTFSTAQQARLEQGAAAVEPTGQRIMKYWLNAEDDRVRPAHEEAGRVYSISNPIPVDQPFVVDGEKLMYPLDPRGSAKNTINCRCVSVPVVVEA